MSQRKDALSVPVPAVEQPKDEVAEALAGRGDLPRRPPRLGQGVRLQIRGRSVHLRGLRTPPAGALRYLALLGPGFIAAVAGDDAGGIATYASVGARFGYELLWVMVVITLSLAVVQEMCGRLGAATGRGLFDLIRERFGIRWTLFAVAIILVANGGLIVSEFVGIGAALELFGVSKYLVVPIAAFAIWGLVIGGSYDRVEKVFIGMALAFLAYPVAAVLGRPPWGDVARGMVVPHLRGDVAYLQLLVGLIGTTITPYMQLFQQSSLIEKGVSRRNYSAERADPYAGAIFSNLIAAFIIIATAATLHASGHYEITSAADAAQALAPVAGKYASALFALGLLGASLLAGAVLPLATAYAVSEAFGFRKGVHLDFRRAKLFVGIFSGLVAIGAALALIPHLPTVQLLVGVQVLNGIMLPLILFFVLILINDARLTGELKNTPAYNILGWGTAVLVTVAVVVLLGSQLLGLLGIHLFAR